MLPEDCSVPFLFWLIISDSEAMKNKLKIGTVLVMLLTGWYACLPPAVDIDVKPADPRLVISSQVIGTNGLIVGLTRSYSPLDTTGTQDTLGQDLLSQVLVENAIVTVSYQSSVDTLVMVTPGLYLNLSVPMIDGEAYTIRASDPSTGLEVFAVTNLQPRRNFDTVYPYIERQNGDTNVYFHYEINDVFGEENYYVVNFVKKVNGGSGFDLGSVFGSGNNQLLTEFELFDDQAFQNYRLVKDSWIPSLGQNDTAAAVLSQITKGYYEFLTAFKRSNSIFNQLTGEPITYPTNVNGGHGYFTLHRQDSHIYDLNLY
jgi:hypothetical protein